MLGQRWMFPLGKYRAHLKYYRLRCRQLVTNDSEMGDKEQDSIKPSEKYTEFKLGEPVFGRNKLDTEFWIKVLKLAALLLTMNTFDY